MIKTMQKVPLLLGLALLAGAFSACEDVLGVKGKGDVVTEVRNVDGFHAVEISTNGYLELRVDSVYHVEIQCEESVLPFLQTIEDNGVLKIHFDRDVYDVDNLKITVSAPNWDAVTLNGSVKVDIPDAISGSLLDLRVSGSGDIRVFNADFAKVLTSITGSGDIDVNGAADQLDCTISGSGSLDALGCPVLTVKVTISGSGNARLDVSESLQATISGSGDIEYRGNPQVTSNISGSGTVRKIP